MFLPILKDKMIAQCELFESDRDYGDVNMEGSSRDNLVLNRRRFVFLTNSALILREEEKRKLKIDAEKAVASELKRKADKEERKRNPQPKKNSNQLILNIKIPRGPE